MKWYEWIVKKKEVKKEVKKEGRKIEVPAQCVRDVCVRLDTYNRENTYTSLYDLWKYIEEKIPEARGMSSNTRLKWDGRHMTFVEIL